MEEFNHIEIQEDNGIGKIKIDGTELKGINNYEVKRDADLVKLTISLDVPPKNLKTIY